jgi:hypothetical protein
MSTTPFTIQTQSQSETYSLTDIYNTHYQLSFDAQLNVGYVNKELPKIPNPPNYSNVNYDFNVGSLTAIDIIDGLTIAKSPNNLSNDQLEDGDIITISYTGNNSIRTWNYTLSVNGSITTVTPDDGNDWPGLLAIISTNVAKILNKNATVQKHDNIEVVNTIFNTTQISMAELFPFIALEKRSEIEPDNTTEIAKLCTYGLLNTINFRKIASNIKCEGESFNLDNIKEFIRKSFYNHFLTKESELIDFLYCLSIMYDSANSRTYENFFVDLYVNINFIYPEKVNKLNNDISTTDATNLVLVKFFGNSVGVVI